MFGLMIAFHMIVCILLIVVVLIQSGRSSGLVEGFSFAESILGTKTPKFFTKLTAVLAVLFMVNCVLLSFLTFQRSRSLIEKQGAKAPVEKKVPVEDKEEVQVQEEPREEPQNVNSLDNPNPAPAE